MTEKKKKTFSAKPLVQILDYSMPHVIRPNILPAGNVIDTVSVGLKSHGPLQHPTVFQVCFLQEA